MGLHSIIDSQIIIANPDNNIPEFEKSLSSRFGEMLLKAEELFGERDMSYTLLGFEFISNGQHIYHLGAEVNKQILIHLPLYASQDYTQCLYMMSHEAFHCLGPNRNVPATRLEEGLATYFAKYYMNFHNLGPDWRTNTANYDEAMADVETLLNIDREFIKKVRSVKQTTSLIDKADLTAINNDPANHALYDKLVTQFIY